MSALCWVLRALHRSAPEKHEHIKSSLIICPIKCWWALAPGKATTDDMFNQGWWISTWFSCTDANTHTSPGDHRESIKIIISRIMSSFFQKKKKKNPFPRVSFCSTHCEPALILLVSSVTTLSLKDQTLVRICFICLEGEQWLIVHSHVLAQETVSGTAPFVICIYPKWSLSLVQVISRGMNKNLSALLHHRPRNS